MTLDPEEVPTHGPVIRDKRRIDPETGEVRERQQTAAPAPPAPTSEIAALQADLAERTGDLQRLQAEYVNYKRRVDRDREHARKLAVGSTISALLPVLDDIARAREHGELTGGFKAVADSLERALGALGLASFGEVGDEFDPRIHDALMHSYSDDVSGPTCQVILQVGYRMDDRVLRPARVAVAEPAGPADPGDPGDPADQGEPEDSAEPEDQAGPALGASDGESSDGEEQ